MNNRILYHPHHNHNSIIGHKPTTNTHYYSNHYQDDKNLKNKMIIFANNNQRMIKSSRIISQMGASAASSTSSLFSSSSSSIPIPTTTTTSSSILSTKEDVTNSSEGNNIHPNKQGNRNKINKMRKKQYRPTKSNTNVNTSISSTSSAVTTTNHNNNNSNNNKKNRTTSSKKHRIRTMFRQAKDMERTGQWRQACIHFKKILEIDPYDSYSYLALGRLESRREGSGGISSSSSSSSNSSNSNNSNHHQQNHFQDNIQILSTEGNKYQQQSLSNIGENNEHMATTTLTSHDNTNYIVETENTNIIITPLSIFQSGPYHSEARLAFYQGTEKCPNSVHLWQAWALHEQSKGNIAFARYLFERALFLDETNPYVCHGYGLMEHRCGKFDVAMELWERPLKTNERSKTTAALVCSLGKLLVSKGELKKARDLYMRHVLKIKSERETCEVYLAAAWLEEKHFLNVNRAEELLNLALRVSPGNSRALVALARLAGRKVDLEISSNGSTSTKDDVVRRRQFAMKRQLQQICEKMINGERPLRKSKGKDSEVLDGRLFNAWADMEVKDRKYDSARRIIVEGMKLFPKDHSVSL